MKEIGAIFVVSISEIRTVQLAAIKRRYNVIICVHVLPSRVPVSFLVFDLDPCKVLTN